MGNTSSSHKNLVFTIVENKQHAQELLNQAEAKDRYLEECHDDKSNAMARQQMSYSANIVDKSTISILKKSLDMASLPPRLLSDLSDVRLVQLMPSADGGMPHTRPGNVICYPDVSVILQTSTVIHELWHIHQRNFQELWTSVFYRIGWKPWNGTLPPVLEKNRRYNPDTIDSPLWIYKDAWVPIPVFRDIANPKVNDTDIWFYHTTLRHHVKNVPLEMAAYYPDLPASAYEHPREITAYMLAEPEKFKAVPAFKDLIGYIGQISLPS